MRKAIWLLLSILVAISAWATPRSVVLRSGQAGNFDPGSLAPKLWLTSDLSKITHSNGLISSWADKSGNGYDFTQSTDANKPYWTRADSLENRLLQSENLTATWVVSGATVSTTAIVETAGGTLHYVRQTSELVKGASYTYTVDASAGTNRNWMALVIRDTAAPVAWFDLTNGVTGTVDAGLTASITHLGAGVYRCSITKVSDLSSTTSRVDTFIGSANGTSSYPGTDGNSINVFRSHFARTGKGYVQTTTFPQYAGLNGRSVVYFPGAATYMSRAATAALDVTRGSASIFMVYSSDGGADASNNKYLFLNEVFNTSGMTSAFTTSGYSWIRTNQAGANTAVTGNTAITAGALGIATFIKNGTSGQWYRNGATDNTAGTSNNSVAATADFWLGHSSQSMQGYRPELIVFDRALSAYEIGRLTDYFKRKWGI